MISDVEAAHILIALSRSKPRVVVKPIKNKEENPLPVLVPRQKRSSSRVPRQMRRSFPMDPSSSSSTAIVAYVSQEDASPPPLSRKKRPMDPSCSTAIVEYLSQEEDASPPLRRKKRPMDPSCSTAIVEYMSQEEDASPPLRRKKRPMDPSCSTAIVEYLSKEEDASPPPLSRKKRPIDPSCSTAIVEYLSQEEDASPPLRRKKRPLDPSCSTAIVGYLSEEEDASPPLRRKKRPPLFPLVANQPKKKKAKAADSPWMKEPTPGWLLTLVNGDEEELKKIIEKELSATDVSRGHNRLSMPCSNIIDLGFLSLTEQRLIAEDEVKKFKTGINAKLVVKFVDSDDLEEFDVNVRKWRMPKKSGSATYVYNLVTGWNKVVDGCGLGQSHKIRLWSYHSDGELCFALSLATPRPPPPTSHPLLLLPPPPPSDTENANTEEMSSALVVYDKSNDDLQPK
ncbi:unnamed protein product [Eruca vesicaria subsp. sativa]|uniref:B3 domain-containing protein n=1 Tax=Eruca vesicaria subsp. sativa TaxID=29727 RepID=A0ABC8L2D9_ERUVS|nr:unnamed protein product [Eruca vesicaria subsp. sativa]